LHAAHAVHLVDPHDGGGGQRDGGDLATLATPAVWITLDG
jgi:hypothetical protein